MTTTTIDPALAAALLNWRKAKAGLRQCEASYTAAMLTFIRPPAGVTAAQASKDHRRAESAYKAKRQRADGVLAALVKQVEESHVYLTDAQLERIAKGQSE